MEMEIFNGTSPRREDTLEEEELGFVLVGDRGRGAGREGQEGEFGTGGRICIGPWVGWHRIRGCRVPGTGCLVRCHILCSNL
jgi:hypothetical protein